MNTPDKYSEKHRVTYYEADFTRRMTLAMMLDIVILASEDQSEKLRVGSDTVKKLNMGWVVIQYSIDIQKMPRVNEMITLVTESKYYNKFFAYREFWIKDDSGNTYVHMTSRWVVMDYKTRKMTKIPNEIVEPYRAEKVVNIPKLPRPVKIDESSEQVTSNQYRVRYLDIDSNQHVNNAHYLDWMVDVLSPEFLNTHTAKHIDLRYENEVKYGYDVNSKVSFAKNGNDLISKHEIYSNGKRSASANITW
ncbi:acyl-[acyl-carrier-protein] thioesterase [Apilactobacillus xinyiensis]|uniref:acyl-[acyl-carrier-protein] thioesterase n=1 Tax=Apilactobacillus xinyiensis TaxID=2841032 RepID=UPI001C7DC0E1|nr:acyl-ACP thioesterase domain-containing protein [Apilactobacillus xinyiensis]MCL0312674.1 thioesterase [Apilactobacillus xinyiensis]